MFLNIMKTYIFEIQTRYVFCEVRIELLHIDMDIYTYISVKLTQTRYNYYLGRMEIRTFIPLVIRILI
jgi:hypothetical protein